MNNYFEVTADPTNHPYRKNALYVKKTYFAVVNVSDSACLTFRFMENGIQSYWVPIHEVGEWGYAPFFVTAKVLDRKLAANDPRPILLHCHAGANRSRCVAHATLCAEGNRQTEVEDNVPSIGDGLPSLFDININKGYIPEDIIAFLAARKQYPDYSMIGLLQVIQSKNIHYRKPNQPTIKFHGIDL